jgi:predicted alpha/beta superfamily hydrolase
MSPSLFWGNAHALDVFSKPLEPGSTNSKQRLWIDMGTLEGKSLQGQTQATEQAKELTSLIQQHHSHRFDIGFLIDQDAKHNESAWAKRLPAALEFLFPTPVPTPDP